MRELVEKLREVIGELKKIQEELGISYLLKKLSDIADDLYYFYEKDAAHFYVRRYLSDTYVRVRGLSNEWPVSKPVSTPLNEIYSAFFSDEEILRNMFSNLIHNLRELVKTLQERLDIAKLVSEAEKLIEELSEEDC
jgi:hypothetical protein